MTAELQGVAVGGTFGWWLAGLAPVAFALAWCLAARRASQAAPGSRTSAMLALLLAGVPVLGWLTYRDGPALGLAALALGMLALMRGPLAGRTLCALRLGRRPPSDPPQDPTP